MKKVYLMARTDEAKCIGDKICENVCPAGAISMVEKKARVDASKCAACFRCLDVCGEGAIQIVRRPEPLVLGVDPMSVDQTQLRDLCQKANLDPEASICHCTPTQAKEVAAAILKGAKSPQAVTRMTGIRSLCGMYCMAPVLRLLQASGVDMTPSPGYKWYNVDVTLWDIPLELARKYPEYHIEEDQQLFHKGTMDNMMLSLK